jgi:hypothetical protein
MKYALSAMVVAVAASTASAEILLEVDLSVMDQITITATNGLSAVTVEGSDTTGFFLDGIFLTDQTAITDTLVSGDLTSFENVPDTTPLLYVSASNPGDGLNVFSFTDDATTTFTAGGQAFSGSATWDIDNATYINFAAVGTMGDIYFPADDVTDLVDAEVLGQYVIIPAPGTLAFFGLAGLVGTRRRRG